MISRLPVCKRPCREQQKLVIILQLLMVLCGLEKQNDSDRIVTDRKAPFSSVCTLASKWLKNTIKVLYLWPFTMVVWINAES